MTTRDIRAHLREIYSVEVSPDLISRVTDAVVDELAEWQGRPLDRGRIPAIVANRKREGIRMPRYAPNKMPPEVKRRYFELIRSGLSGSQASQRVGVSLSCGSLWFIDAGRVAFIDAPISPRYLSQDDRIEIAGRPCRPIAGSFVVRYLGWRFSTRRCVMASWARTSPTPSTTRSLSTRQVMTRCAGWCSAQTGPETCWNWW
jgi:hypothetical protein